MAAVKQHYECALALITDLVGGKWKMNIIWHLREGVLRFSELQRHLPGITQKMLTQQLRELEECGLVIRTVYPVVPPKVEYGLSAEAGELIPILDELRKWGHLYADRRGITRNIAHGPLTVPGVPDLDVRDKKAS